MAAKLNKDKEKMLSHYATNREKQLKAIVAHLENDNRVVAVWLTGSLSKGKDDAISDVDITLVLTDEAANILCKRPFQEGSKIPPERLKFFSHFDIPAILHENHNNAPPGGTFTFIQYKETGLLIDWILIPQSTAKRPHDSLLLFTKADIPLQSSPKPLKTAERTKIASEKTAFFWMMACVIVKYIVREDTLLFNSWLDELHWLVNDVTGLISGEEAVFAPKNRLPLALIAADQKEALRAVCQRMALLAPAIVELGGYVPNDPISAVEKRLALV